MIFNFDIWFNETGLGFSIVIYERLGEKELQNYTLIKLGFHIQIKILGYELINYEHESYGTVRTELM